MPLWRLRSGVAALASALTLGLALSACSDTGTKFEPALDGAADRADASEPAGSGPGGGPPRGDAATGLRPYGDATWPAYSVSPRRSSLAVRTSPNGPVTRTFDDVLPSGAPLTFLLVGRDARWLRVALPVRPNGSTGWVRQSDVRLSGIRYRLDVLRSRHLLQLYRDDQLVDSFPVGIGERETPTPGGLYYLIELLEPPDESGPYGPYAYGLSGFSPVLRNFAGGEGVIGLHGTNDPAGIGRDVSKGCIRLHNADITRLADLLPLGTPVRILS